MRNADNFDFRCQKTGDDVLLWMSFGYCKLSRFHDVLPCLLGLSSGGKKRCIWVQSLHWKMDLSCRFLHWWRWIWLLSADSRAQRGKPGVAASVSSVKNYPGRRGTETESRHAERENHHGKYIYICLSKQWFRCARLVSNTMIFFSVGRIGYCSLPQSPSRSVESESRPGTSASGPQELHCTWNAAVEVLHVAVSNSVWVLCFITFQIMDKQNVFVSLHLRHQMRRQRKTTADLHLPIGSAIVTWLKCVGWLENRSFYGESGSSPK